MHFIFLLPSFRVNSQLRVSTGISTESRAIMQEFLAFISKTLSSLENLVFVKKEQGRRRFSGRDRCPGEESRKWGISRTVGIGDLVSLGEDSRS